MLTLRDAIPKQQTLATAEFATLRMRLLKIAARVTETAARIRIAFAAAYSQATLVRGIALSSHRAVTHGAIAPAKPDRAPGSDGLDTPDAMNRTG